MFSILILWIYDEMAIFRIVILFYEYHYFPYRYEIVCYYVQVFYPEIFIYSTF